MLADLFFSTVTMTPIFAADEDTDADGWTIGKFLGSLQQSFASYGHILTSLIGIVMVIAGVYQVAKNLISHGKGGQTNWIVTFALILVGGALALTSGWKLLGDAATSSSHQLTEWTQGNPDGSGEVSDPFSSEDDDGH